MGTAKPRENWGEVAVTSRSTLALKQSRRLIKKARKVTSFWYCTMSFKDARDALLVAHDDETIDDEEFVLLYEQNTSTNPSFPYEEYGDFILDDIDTAECKAEFRFEKNDLPLLAEVLQIPGQFICQQRTVCAGMEWEACAWR